MQSISQLNIKLFADGADKTGMLEMYQNPLIKGFTTNPTLMHKAGITDYQQFAIDMLAHISDRPISFEVFSDDFDEMYIQALTIANWGNNVYVKVPVTNTLGESSADLIKALATAGVQQNITALMTLDQVEMVTDALQSSRSAYISVFAGRIADTGIDPVPFMREALNIMNPYEQLELIWASPRELLNVFQADAVGCHIITATNDILKKMPLVGKALQAYSLETVNMFYNDAQKAGFKLLTEKIVKEVA